MKIDRASKQKGFIGVLIILIVGLLSIGIVAAIYFIKNKTAVRPSSLPGQTQIEFLNKASQLITQTQTHQIRIRLVYAPKPSGADIPFAPSPLASSAAPQSSTSPLAPIGANREKLICHQKSPTDTMIVCNPVEGDAKVVTPLSDTLEFPTKFKIANDIVANLSNAQIQDFIQNKTFDWQLSSGQGIKKVYVQFGKGEGDISWAEPIANQIKVGSIF